MENDDREELIPWSKSEMHDAWINSTELAKKQLHECARLRKVRNELQDCLKAAILLAECGEIPAAVTVQKWANLLSK